MLVFLLALLVVLPLEALGVVSPIVVSVVMTFLLIAGVVAIAERRYTTILVSVVALVSLVLKWAYFIRPDERVQAYQRVFAMLALGLLTAFLLRHVFQDGPVTSDRIQGAVAVYLLLGMIWGLGYELVNQLVPGAIQFSVRQDPAGFSFAHPLAYFSFVTLTTVGYGDITPVHPIARTLAIVEALVGQLYPVILIGRLVGLQIASRPQGQA